MRAAARRRLPAIDPQVQSGELQRFSEAVGRASQLFREVDEAFQRVTTGQDLADREVLWQRAAEFRRTVDEVRSHAAAIHDEERRRSDRRWAVTGELLGRRHVDLAPTRTDDGRDSAVGRELDAALATAEDRFRAAQQSFLDLRAAHAAGQPGDLEGWRQRVADFRTAMVDVHRLTSALRHPNQPGA